MALLTSTALYCTRSLTSVGSGDPMCPSTLVHPTCEGICRGDQSPCPPQSITQSLLPQAGRLVVYKDLFWSDVVETAV